MKMREKQAVSVDCTYRSDFACQFRVTIARDGRTVTDDLRIEARPGQALGRIKEFCDRYHLDVMELMHKLARSVEEPELSVTGGAI
ncbi:MAG: hypothetical protein KIT79_16065 [Deltaproteobacteria bacterium]|nr:hypothetical protein [Deltaproteobacteria bacterium]